MADLTQLAQSLQDNEAFQAALDKQRSGALERLASIEHSNQAAFYAAQAIVAVVDGIRGDLDQFIRTGKPPKPAGIA